MVVQPAGQRHVQVSPACFRKQAVGRLLEEGMGEAIPPLLAANRLDQIAAADVVEVGVDRPVDQRGHRRGREVAARHRGNAQHLALRVGQRLQASRQQQTDRRRQTLDALRVTDQRRQMLGEQRVTLGDAGHPLSLLRPERWPGVAEQAQRLRIVEPFQRDREHVRARAPARPPIGELRPGGADHHQGPAAALTEQLIDDIQQHVIGPVDVLQHHHHRLLGGHRPQHPRGRPGDVRRAGRARPLDHGRHRAGVAGSPVTAYGIRCRLRPGGPRPAAPATTPRRSPGTAR